MYLRDTCIVRNYYIFNESNTCHKLINISLLLPICRFFFHLSDHETVVWQSYTQEHMNNSLLPRNLYNELL